MDQEELDHAMSLRRQAERAAHEARVEVLRQQVLAEAASRAGETGNSPLAAPTASGPVAPPPSRPPATVRPVTPAASRPPVPVARLVTSNPMTNAGSLQVPSHSDNRTEEVGPRREVWLLVVMALIAVVLASSAWVLMRQPAERTRAREQAAADQRKAAEDAVALNAKQDAEKRRQELARQEVGRREEAAKRVEAPRSREATESLEHKLAVINAGRYVAVSDPSVSRFRSLLRKLESKTTNSQQEIADISVRGQKILWEQYKRRLGLLELMEAADQSLPESSIRLKYQEILAALVTLLGRG